MGGVGNTDRHPRLQELFQSLRCIRSVLVCTIFHKPVVFRKREFNCRGIVRFQIPCKSSRYKPTLISPIKMIHKRKLDIFKFSWGVFRQKICFFQLILPPTEDIGRNHCPALPSFLRHIIPSRFPAHIFSPIFTRASRNRKETGYYYHTEQEKLHHTRLHIIRCPIKIQQRRNHVSPPLFAIFPYSNLHFTFVNRFQHEIFFFLLLNSHLSLILKKDRLTSRGYMQIIRCSPGNIYLPAEKTRKYQKS